MQTLIYLLAGIVIATRPDPAPGLDMPKKKARQYECERWTIERVEQERPGEVMPLRPRGDFIDRNAMVCSEKLMRPGLREKRDEAILAQLDETSREMVSLAASVSPELRDRTWLVETYYPNTQVTPKISFATKNALVNEGLSVSDRLVTLGVGDVDVITRMSPEDAYPAACQRYVGTGSLDDDDVLLAIIMVDGRETQLHAGLCDRGRWSWLR